SVDLISIGNGTASRETDKLAAELIRKHPELKLTKVVVSEAGASVYSASELASHEFPNLDVSLRGAVSIARRLQDPLAELVKIDPKSIGVGQYQHDVSQTKLAKSLDAVVEDCVNAVGVDVNTASPALLARISGLSASLAETLVRFRDEHGAFSNREALRKVPRLGAKTFEQAAGFLRVMGGDNPLDASAVHPEAYPVVEQILADLGKPLKELTGDTRTLRALDPGRYISEQFGLPTVCDILKELEKPGRDPRPQFKTAAFQEGIEDLKDLQPNMVLEGVVTNVTNFGAFVDVGVHQDGLVHISMMSHKFVKDPRELVKAGDVVKVKVLEVDLQRRRIALSMKLEAPPAQSNERPREERRAAGSREVGGPATRDGGGPPTAEERGSPQQIARALPRRDHKGAQTRDDRIGGSRDGRDGRRDRRDGQRDNRGAQREGRDSREARQDGRSDSREGRNDAREARPDGRSDNRENHRDGRADREGRRSDRDTAGRHARGGASRDDRGPRREERGFPRDGRDSGQRDSSRQQRPANGGESQSNGAMAEAWAQALKRR
ncbi:MAG: helix-hairpin-helix domain-containing protein, partial [Sinobacteraceae bacterium]|nr:helix-hairpin-helix domain-containing protein [Nevskiaceae bacterium]